MSKSDNMLAILWLLKSRRRMTAHQLADALEVSVRTVYRHIDALCASGVPIMSETGHNGGYSLLPTFTEAPLLFDTEEQKALAQAALFAKESGYPFGDALERAVSKLKLYNNPEQLHTLNRHLTGFDVISSHPDPLLQPILQELESAVAGGYSLSMNYAKGHDTPSGQRIIDPYGIVHWKERWYLIAHCHLRSAVRSFRADRIQSLHRTDARFNRPAGFSARQFLMENLLPDPSAAASVTVRLRGTEQAVEDLSRHWLFGHALTHRYGCEVHLQLDEEALQTYVPFMLMHYGKSLQVLEPARLRESMIRTTAQLLAHYQEQTIPPGPEASVRIGME